MSSSGVIELCCVALYIGRCLKVCLSCTFIRQVDTIQGVLIFRFMAPIYYLNVAVFRTRLEMECDLHKRQAQPGGEQKGCLERILPPVRIRPAATLKFPPNISAPWDHFYQTESPYSQPILTMYRSISLAVAFNL